MWVVCADGAIQNAAELGAAVLFGAGPWVRTIIANTVDNLLGTSVLLSRRMTQTT